jgi:hypothetical protein
MYLFADYTKIFHPITINNSDFTTIETDISILENWSTKWLLKFNAAKCKNMHLRFPSGTVPSLTDTEKDLGMIIDNKLSFDKHINEQTKKANKTLGIIRRTFHNLTASNFKKLFTSLVRPLLEYASSVIVQLYLGGLVSFNFRLPFIPCIQNL